MEATRSSHRVLDVHVVTPGEEIWSGVARRLTARSSAGELGVLPGHEPMLATLGDGPMRLESDLGRMTAHVRGGFLSIAPTSNGVTRVDILAEFVDELDRDETVE